MTIEATPPVPKQYLLMVDESSMQLMMRILPTMIFVQVEGIKVNGQDNHQFLVNPLQKPLEMPIAEMPVMDVMDVAG